MTSALLNSKTPLKIRENTFDPHVLFEITKKCSYFCKHCFTYGGEVSKEEMNLDQIKQCLDLLYATGFTEVTLSGGDPALRPDLVEIASHAKRLGLVTHVFSTQLSERQIKELMSLITIFATSLDGVPSYHGWLRGNRKAFEDTVALLAIVKDYGLTAHVQMSVTKANLNQIPFVLDICRKLDVSSLKLAHISHIGRAKNFYDLLKPSNTLFKIAWDYAEKSKSDVSNRPVISTNLQSVAELKYSAAFYRAMKIHLLPDGCLLPFIGVERNWRLANLLESDSLSDAIMESTTASQVQKIIYNVWTYMTDSLSDNFLVPFDDLVSEVLLEVKFGESA